MGNPKGYPSGGGYLRSRYPWTRQIHNLHPLTVGFLYEISRVYRLTGMKPNVPSPSALEENEMVRDALITGVIAGLFALAGGAGGSYIGTTLAMKATAPRSAEVALSRLHDVSS